VDIAIVSPARTDNVRTLAALLLDRGHTVHVLEAETMRSPEGMREYCSRIAGSDALVVIDRWWFPDTTFAVGVAVGAYVPVVTVGINPGTYAAIRYAARVVAADIAEALRVVESYQSWLTGQGDSDVNPLLSTGAAHEC